MDPIPNGLDLQEEGIEKFTNMIKATHRSVQLEGLVSLRKLISVDDYPPIQKVFDSGIVPELLEILVCEDDSQFQIESSWCVLNICSGEAKFVDHIIDLGGLEILINLLNSEKDEVVSHVSFSRSSFDREFSPKQALGSIRNIAGTGSKYRDMCIQKDCMKKFLQLFETCSIPRGEILDDIIDAISSLIIENPPPQWEEVLPALPVLLKALINRYSQRAIERALWAIASITEAEENLQEVIDQGCVLYLMFYLRETDSEILSSTLRALGKILVGTNYQADEVLKYDEFLPRIFELTTNERKEIQRDAFWVISNIARGPFDQIGMIFENDNYLERLKTAVATESDTVVHEAAWAICSILLCGNSDQICIAVKKHGLLESLPHVLAISDKDLKKDTLEAILNILKNEESSEIINHLEILQKIQQAGLLEIIQDLAQDSDFEEDVEKILEYFPQLEKEKENDKEEEK